MGILTVRDVGSMDDHALHLRRAILLGLTSGPRILTCARIVSATSPGCRIFTTMYRPADGVDEIRKAVREQLAMGADFVKIMATGARSVVLEDPEPAQLTREEIRTVVDGDPLEDPSVLQDPARIHLVVQAGIPVNTAKTEM
jgi:imidazolonepropionase-like amidohydrolase